MKCLKNYIGKLYIIFYSNKVFSSPTNYFSSFFSIAKHLSFSLFKFIHIIPIIFQCCVSVFYTVPSLSLWGTEVRGFEINDYES